MKLNAQIIWQNLNETFPAELLGAFSDDLTLGRPEFFVDESKPMQAGHLYILPSDRFPRHPEFEKGTVLICAGPLPPISRLRDRAGIILLKDRADPYELINVVTKIYDKYSNWQHRLSELLETSADLSEMTEITSHLFGNPVMVLDSDFRFLATAGYENLADSPEAFDAMGSDKLSISALNQFLGSMDLQLENHDPIRVDIGDRSSLSVNLYDRDDYAGSVSVEYRNVPALPGDPALLQFFASYLIRAMRKHSQFMTSDRSLLQRAFTNLINEVPVDSETRRKVMAMNEEKHWVCAVVHPNERLARVPFAYMCAQLEGAFQRCTAFEHHSNIVAVFCADDLPKDPDFRAEVERRLSLMSEDHDIKVGVSSDFADPFSARLYYSQAVAALENGTILEPEGSFHYFRDYALAELIINAQNDLPLELYFPDGLKRLFEHDEASATSYVETLRSYLNNNMSVTATSNELHIHRSTLLERLSRIRRELRENLEDPDVRLQMLIVLKALEIREQVLGVGAQT